MANKLVARLCLMYGAPDIDDTASWFAEMDRLVANYSEAELDKAADLVLRAHRGRAFPSVSEMLTACADAREILPHPVGLEDMTPEKADFLARKFVNGLRTHSKTGKVEPADGQFSERFLSHPLVRQSIGEGWDRELRLLLIHQIRRQIMAKRSYDVIEDFMPPKEWVSAAQNQAERFRLAAEWQKKHMKGGLDFTALLKNIDPGASA